MTPSLALVMRLSCFAELVEACELSAYHHLINRTSIAHQQHINNTSKARFISKHNTDPCINIANFKKIPCAMLAAGGCDVPASLDELLIELIIACNARISVASAPISNNHLACIHTFTPHSCKPAFVSNLCLTSVCKVCIAVSDATSAQAFNSRQY